MEAIMGLAPGDEAATQVAIAAASENEAVARRGLWEERRQAERNGFTGWVWLGGNEVVSARAWTR
jgi:hypothetical protein